MKTKIPRYVVEGPAPWDGTWAVMDRPNKSVYSGGHTEAKADFLAAQENLREAKVYLERAEGKGVKVKFEW